MDKNPGYKQLRNICENTIKKIAQSYANAIQDLLDGSERAYNNAASNITGSGVSIWTNSLANAMWYNFLEGRVLSKQAREADKQYNAEIQRISSESTNNQKKNETRIKTEYYYPECNASISKLMAVMLDIYLNKLDKNNIINIDELTKYNIEESDEILKNLDIIPQKSGVLKKAFEKCPYNVSIYEKALEFELFDDETVQTIKYIGLEKSFTSLLNSYIGSINKVTDLSRIQQNEYYVHLLAIFYNSTDKEYRYQLTNYVTTLIKNKYDYLYEIINDDNACTKYSEAHKHNKDLDNTITEEVRNIVTPSQIDYLINECAHYDILKMISPEELKDVTDKETIDNYLINKLKTRILPKVIKILEDEENDRKNIIILHEQKSRELTELEKARVKKENRTTLLIASFIGLLVISVMIIVLFHTSKKNNQSQAEIQKIEQDYKKYIQTNGVLIEDLYIGMTLDEVRNILGQEDILRNEDFNWGDERELVYNKKTYSIIVKVDRKNFVREIEWTLSDPNESTINPINLKTIESYYIYKFKDAYDSQEYTLLEGSFDNKGFTFYVFDSISDVSDWNEHYISYAIKYKDGTPYLISIDECNYN